MESLTNKVLLFQKTGQGLQEIVAAVSMRVYQFPRWKLGWDEDACGEFYLFFHPRLLRLVGRFRDQGKPFESYLASVLAWQLRNFARGRGRAERSWSVALRLQAEDPDGERSEPPRDPVLVPAAIRGVIRSDADRRNLVYLVLKCSRTLDEATMSALAELARFDLDRLQCLAEQLRREREPRDRRLETFRLRRNRAFSLARLLETELQGETDPERIAALRCRVSSARRRMEAAMKRMSRVGLAPTNREIARVLGVPKGTVDSGLYWLKRKLSPVYDPDELRLA